MHVDCPFLRFVPVRRRLESMLSAVPNYDEPDRAGRLKKDRSAVMHLLATYIGFFLEMPGKMPSSKL